MKPLAQALTKFGLTEYESNVYLTLMKYGTCTIKDITAKSNVPRTKVYPVLKALQKRRLADIEQSNPVKAKGLPPDASLTNPIKNMEQDLKTMKKAFAEIRRIHEISSASNQLETREHYVIRNQEEAIRHFNEAISDASEEIVLVLNHEGLELLSRCCLDPINYAAKNEVQVKVMVNATRQDTNLLNHFITPVNLRHIPFSPENNMLLADGKDLMIFKKVLMADSKGTSILVELYHGCEMCNFIKATMAGMDKSASRELGILLPTIEHNWLPEGAIDNPLSNQIPPVFYYQLIDSLSTKLGTKCNSTLTDLGRKTLETLKKSQIVTIPSNLNESLDLISSLYLLYDGIQCDIIYDNPLDLVTCELSGELSPYYKKAADNNFLIPPSIFGFLFLGVLDVFGFDASLGEMDFNTEENYWMLQYKLTTRAANKVSSVEATKEAIQKI
jgi:sugar-specific transcriptional regulator TrmB